MRNKKWSLLAAIFLTMALVGPVQAAQPKSMRARVVAVVHRGYNCTLWLVVGGSQLGYSTHGWSCDLKVGQVLTAKVSTITVYGLPTLGVCYRWFCPRSRFQIMTVVGLS